MPVMDRPGGSLVANHCHFQQRTARISAGPCAGPPQPGQCPDPQGGRVISPCSVFLWLSGGCSCLRVLECKGPDCTRTHRWELGLIPPPPSPPPSPYSECSPRQTLVINTLFSLFLFFSYCLSFVSFLSSFFTVICVCCFPLSPVISDYCCSPCCIRLLFDSVVVLFSGCS